MGLNIKKSRLRIANIIEEGKLGGPQIRIALVAEALKDHVDTTIILPKNSSGFINLIKNKKLNYQTFSLSRITKEWVEALKYVTFSLYEIIIVAKFLKKKNFDLVHVSGGSWQFKGVLAGKLAGIRVIWHLNDTYVPLALRMIFYVLSHFADAFIYASISTKKYYEKYIKLNAMGFIIPAPVDTSFFDLNSVKQNSDQLPFDKKNSIIVGTVANINPIKGLETIVLIASKIQKKYRNVLFVIFGKTFNNQVNYLKKLKKMCLELSLNNIFFLEPQSDIASYVKFFDIYLCSSIAESSPMAVWEAMSMSKPIVTTSVGDAPIYVKHGHNGFIANVGDYDRLTQNLEKYINNQNLRKLHGLRSRDIAIKNLDIKICADNHLEAYTKVRNLKL